MNIDKVTEYANAFIPESSKGFTIIRESKTTHKYSMISAIYSSFTSVSQEAEKLAQYDSDSIYHIVQRTMSYTHIESHYNKS